LTAYPTPPADDPARRTPELDGLRGVAILLVLVNNFYDGPSNGGLDYVVYHLAKSGWVGVDLFFVLSGFLITGILCDTRNSERYFRNFYARRVLRIFPLYYGFLIVWSVLLAHSPVFTLTQARGWHATQWWYWLYAANFHLAFAPGAAAGEPTVFWSLAVEEQFYLVWPLVVATVQQARLAAVSLALISAAVLLRVAWHALGPADAYPEALYFLTPARMDALATGSLLAALWRIPSRRAWLTRWSGPAAAGTTAVLSLWLVWDHGLRKEAPGVQTVGYTLVALTAGAWLLRSIGSRADHPWRRIVAHPALRFFGWYSYGIYVWHELVYHLSRNVSWVVHPPRWLGSGVPASLGVGILLTGITTGLAVLSWHGYERHFLRLKSLFPYRRPVRRADGPASGPPSPLPVRESGR
jgi:peptidoglycan/LPS O-acetylase OafA/YrhL